MAPLAKLRAVPTPASLFKPSTMAMLSWENSTCGHGRESHQLVASLLSLGGGGGGGGRTHTYGQVACQFATQAHPLDCWPQLTLPTSTFSASSLRKASNWLGFNVRRLKMDISSSQSGSWVS